MKEVELAFDYGDIVRYKLWSKDFIVLAFCVYQDVVRYLIQDGMWEEHYCLASEIIGVKEATKTTIWFCVKKD